MRGGGCGFRRGSVGVVLFCIVEDCADSEFEGGPSMICTMKPLPFPEGDNISNSGNPFGGLVVYRVLLLREGTFFFREDIVGKLCKALSDAMAAQQ